MNQRGIVNFVSIIIIVVLIGILGYIAVRKPAQIKVAQIKEQPSSLSVTCISEQDGVPTITSISPVSGRVGAEIKIRGCNLAGFEGDLDVVFVRSDGAEIPLYGGSWYPGYGGETERGILIMVTLQSYCESGFVVGRYSDLVAPCEKVSATSGVYKVYVTAWGKQSNKVTFTVN